MMRSVTALEIKDLESEHLKEYKAPMRKPATLRGMVQAYRELRALPSVQTTADLHSGAIADWILAHPGRSSVRTESLLRNMKVIFNFAISRGWLAISPFENRKLRHWMRSDAVPSRNHNRVWHRTPDEIRQLLEYLDERASTSWRARRLQCLIYVYVYTAFRKQEALHLLASNVDFDRMILTIEPLAPLWTPKTVPSARTVPMAEILADVLEPWVQICGSEVTRKRTGWGFLFPGARLVGPWTGGSPGYSAYTEFVAAAHAAGIGNVSPIYARIWFGSNGKAMGMGEKEVQAWLGQSCPYTQRFYDREKIETLRPSAKRLELFYGEQA
jgi:integrase